MSAPALARTLIRHRNRRAPSERAYDPVTVRSSTPPSGPILVGADTVLRRWRLDDVDAVVEACNDPETARWLPLPKPYTREDAVAYVGGVTERWETGQSLAFCIEHRGAPVGSIEVTPRGDPPTIGYWLAPRARGKGLMTEAVRAVSQWAAAALGVAELWIFTDPGNVASRAVARRAGFVEEPEVQALADGEVQVAHRWRPSGASHSPGDS
jgi:RimJ/RimL family protein N-acetyltransferase